MKKAIFLMLVLNACFDVFSQSDTLYTLNKKKIPCKIYEISDYEIKYRAGSFDGPIVVTDRTNFYKYVLSNGYSEIFVPDELMIENQHQDILGNRQVVKIHPFCFANNQVSLSYEKVLKVGTNFDMEMGYINSSITEYPIFGGNNMSRNFFNSGFYMKPGVKFLLAPSYPTKGLKFTHPLKGSYVRLDLCMSVINFTGVQNTVYQPGAYASTTISTDIHSFAYGGFVNYGHQTILGNILTLDIYIGAGFTAQNNTYSNPSFLPSNSYYSYFDAKSIYNYHGFLRAPQVGLSVTGGFRIGYIIPSNTGKSKK